MGLLIDIHFLWIRIFRRILINLKLTYVYETKYGLKNYNIKFLTETGIIKEGKLLLLKPSEIFVDGDYLKDQYSLVDMSIDNTPHCQLMKDLLDKKPVAESDYIQRFYKGCLDWRDIEKPKTDYTVFMKKFEDIKKSVESDSYPPVQVYRLGHRLYVHDGKHRAAMCAALSKDVRCCEVSHLYYTTGAWIYLYKFIVNRDQYKKHTLFYNKIKENEESK